MGTNRTSKPSTRQIGSAGSTKVTYDDMYGAARRAKDEIGYRFFSRLADAVSVQQDPMTGDGNFIDGVFHGR